MAPSEESRKSRLRDKGASRLFIVLMKRAGITLACFACIVSMTKKYDRNVISRLYLVVVKMDMSVSSLRKHVTEL